MSCREITGTTLLAVLLAATPALAQRTGTSLGVQAAMVSDSVSGGETSGGGSGGVFVRSDAAWSGGRTRITWRLDQSSQIRRSPGGGSTAWDQQSAHAGLTLRSTRVTTIDVNAGWQWSPRLAVGLPQPDGSDGMAAPAIEVPGVGSMTARLGGRLTHAFTRRRSGDAAFTLERATAGGRTIVTQRVAAGVSQQLGRQSSLAIKQAATRRGSSGATGVESNDSFETTVTVARRVGAATSFTAALIPSLFRRETSARDAGTSFHFGGGAAVERRWAAGWRTTLSLQQSLLSGEGYATPVYARSFGGSAAGRLGRFAVTGSLSRVIGGQMADGTRGPGGQSLSVAASRRLTRHVAMAAEYQQTRVQRAGPEPPAGATHLLNRRLRLSATVPVSPR